MKVSVEKDIEYCDQCPFAEKSRVYTSDSWDDVRKIHCKKLDKVVHSYLDWYDKANVPNDCPFKG